MLDLLSKPQAAAQLLSSEPHPQASTSTAAPTLPHNGDTADDSQGAVVQAAPAHAHGPVTGPAEAQQDDPWTSGKVAQPVSAELKCTVSQEAASDAAAREAGAPEYQHSAMQSFPQAGPSSIPVPVQLPALEPELGADTQAPAEQPREPSQGPSHVADGNLHPGDRQAVVAGMPRVTAIEQAPAQPHNHLNYTTGAGTNQQPLLQSAGTTDQQGTAAGKQLATAGTAQAGGSTSGKGAKHKGGGKGAKTQKLGGQLTGSAAHALAVLQAGPPSRYVRNEEEAGACMLLIWRHL